MERCFGRDKVRKQEIGYQPTLAQIILVTVINSCFRVFIFVIFFIVNYSLCLRSIMDNFGIYAFVWLDFDKRRLRAFATSSAGSLVADKASYYIITSQNVVLMLVYIR